MHVSDVELVKRSLERESHDDNSLGGAELDHDGILGLDVRGPTSGTTPKDETPPLTGLSSMSGRENQPLTD